MATERPGAITQAKVDAYDTGMHEVLPRVMGLNVLVRSECSPNAERFEEVIDSLFALDVPIGRAGLSFAMDPEGSSWSFAELYASSVRMQDEIRRIFKGPPAERPAPKTGSAA